METLKVFRDIINGKIILDRLWRNILKNMGKIKVS